jgi:superfamily II DNA or RNA helicase
MGEIEQVIEAVRGECSPALWQRAQQLARRGMLDGKRTHNDELELRLLTRGGMTAPRVVLSLRHRDWTCECPSDEPACIHVAATAQALGEAIARGDSLVALEAPVTKVRYLLTRRDGAIAFDRMLVHGPKLVPMERRLTTQRASEPDSLPASPADLAVDVLLGSFTSGKIPRALVGRLLAALAECSDVRFDDEPIALGEPHSGLRVMVEDCPGGFRVSAVQDPELEEFFENGAVRVAGVLRPLRELDLSARDLEELRAGRIWGLGEVANLVGRVLPALRERLPVTITSELLPSATPMAPRLAFRTDHDGEVLGVMPLIVYGDPPVARVDGDKLTHLGGALPIRDDEAERGLRDVLRARLDMEPGRPQRFEGRRALDIAESLRALVDVVIEGDGLAACFIAAPLELELDASQAFDLRFVSRGEGDGKERVARAGAVIDAWQRGDSLVPLAGGGWAPLPPGLLDRVGHIVADLIAARGEGGDLPASAVPDLAKLCELLDKPPPPALDGLRPLLTGFDGVPASDLPPDLTATLRGYQRAGADWLALLSRARLGAMLADDMGLGKTLQALCVIEKPTLVVAPASVIHNWRSEIARFRPALRTHVYHGAGRALAPDADVTLTTYAILRLDADALAACAWDTVILDEAQQIKNPESQVAQAAFGLRARFRMTLSGTPVENRLDELWSQMRFLNPGLLGGRQDFARRYAQPIALGDAASLSRMRSRLKPFLLRRRKSEVARELPPRTDVVLRCELEVRERELYDAVRAAARKEVVAELEAGGSVLAALEALLRLRQACCHPALLPGQTSDTSAKVSLLMERLEEGIAEGHKALVFSQWTSFLDLVEPHIERAGIAFTRLDGSTRDRAGVVAKFQDPGGPPLMLISLKAGGVGLNLTAADHVYLLDPWWNPAVEEQAADRAHRIGQDRPVLVHRLVAADSVEERMLELQERKRALAEAATGAGGAVGGLTRDDLLALLG